MQELASFVIPSHNCVTFLPAAVESVRCQTHKDVEIVVVNDGSTDNTRQYLDWLVKNEPRAVVIHNEKCLGRSESRNIGNEAAKGQFIYVLDADDMAHDKRVEKTLPKLKDSHFVHGMAEHIDCLGNRMGLLPCDVFSMEKMLQDKLLQSGIVHSTVCYTKDFAEKFPYRGGKMADLGLDDWAQQIEAATSGVKFEYVPFLLCHYRHLPTAISNTRKPDEMLAVKKEYLEALQFASAGAK
jgi:glycosyltransferase involved in cell wall biosynthesis